MELRDQVIAPTNRIESGRGSHDPRQSLQSLVAHRTVLNNDDHGKAFNRPGQASDDGTMIKLAITASRLPQIAGAPVVLEGNPQECPD
jgi:hypothetical protein